MVRDTVKQSTDTELLLTSPMVTTREGGPSEPDNAGVPRKFSGQVDHAALLNRIAECLKYEMRFKPTISHADKMALKGALYRTQFVSLFVNDLLAKFSKNSPERHNLNVTFDDIFSLMNPIINGSISSNGFLNLPVVQVMEYERCLEDLINLYYVPNPMALTQWQRLKYQLGFGKHK